MAYNPILQRTLMFGGNDFTRAFNDLWGYDFKENTWRELTPENLPEPRQMHGMVFDSTNLVMIMFGGRRSDGGAAFQDT